MRIVVIGADAAGMSAAHAALRGTAAAGEPAEVVVLEATGDTSYSACGIPYWLAGDVADDSALVARSAQAHRDAGIDLRLNTRATALDLVARRVRFRAPDGTDGQVAYDELVLATGAHPLIPAWAYAADRSLVDGVHPVKNLDDARLWHALIAEPEPGPGSVAGDGPRRAVVVGAGYIGLEMAEALLRRGFHTTVVTRSGVMGSLDADMGDRVAAAMRAAGVQVRTGMTVAGITAADGRVRAVTTDAGDEIPADVVVLALGVVPASELGRAAGLPTGAGGGYLPDAQGRLAPHVWAAGDCCETEHRLTGTRTFIPLGTHANKQGRVVGQVLAGGEQRFDGILGTAITRFVAGGQHAEVARTGLTTAQAEEAGHDVATLVTEASTASGYMPESAPVAVKVIADRGTRALLGVQIVGGPGAGKRIDAAAVALWARMSVNDLAALDMSYAPPFATVWDAVQIAARRLADAL